MPPILLEIPNSVFFQHPFRQTSIPDKGQGLVASMSIPAGSRVLSEAPILSFPGDTYSVPEITEAFLALDNYERAAFLKLYAHMSPTRKTYIRERLGSVYDSMAPAWKRVFEILITNDYGGHVFLVGSRFNHSCAPNVEYIWNANTGCGTFHAIQNIKKDEELAISYLRGANWTKEQRSDVLEDMGIICTCHLCQNTKRARLNDQARIDRRADLVFLAEQESLGVDGDWERCEKICVRMAASQKVEGAMTKQMSESFHHAAKYNWRLRKLYKVVHYVGLELQHEKMCKGIDHPHYIRGLQMLARIQTAEEDLGAYESTDYVSYLDEDNNRITNRWARYEKLQAQRQMGHTMSEPPEDRQLQNLEKAVWWARRDLDRTLSDDVDSKHAVVHWKLKNVEYLERRVRSMNGDASGRSAYADIVSWLQRGELD